MLILQAYVYKDNSGECAAFLVNYDSRDATVLFENLSYKLPPESISILPNCKNIAFNTAQVTYFCSVAASFFIQIDRVHHILKFFSVLTVKAPN